MAQTIEQFAAEYFAAAVDPDRERYVALFADEAVVHDDGRTYHGLDEVRGWRGEVPPVRYDVRGVTGERRACTAVAEVSGDFPGSPVELRFTFERDERGKITVLDIAP